MVKTLAITMLAMLPWVGSCAKKKDDEMGSAQVAFSNGTALSLTTTPDGSTGTVTDHGSTVQAYPATTFGAKLVQIYLVSDVMDDGQTNSGGVAYIWINPACGTVTQDNGSITMANSGACDTTAITDYFEFARSTDAVNADLNSQKIPIPTGTYKYIRVQICDNSKAEDNMRIASTTGGLTTAKTVRTGNCVVPPAKIDPPLVIEKDQAVSISLKYDLSQALVDYLYDIDAGTYKSQDTVPKYCAATDSGVGERCVRDIEYTPSVSAE